MKRPIEPRESDEAQEEASAAAKPFNIFEGIVEEPLTPVDTKLESEKQTGALIQRESGLSSNETATPPQGPVVGDYRKVLALLLFLALLVGVVIGIALN